MSKVSNRPPGISMGLSGQYKVAIVDAATDEIVWEQKEWKNNLILNLGMDMLYVQALVESFEVAIIGTGSALNYITSSDATASVYGKNLELYPGIVFTEFTSSNGAGINLGGWTASAAPGDVIKFNNTESTVMSVVSCSANGLGLLVTSSYSGTDRENYTGVTGSFTIYKTSQTRLIGETKRTSTVLSGYCGSTIVYNCNSCSNWRTFDFTPETGAIDYREVGLGWSSTALTRGTTWSRIILDSPLPLIAGQKARLYYRLFTEVNPITPVSFSLYFPGWGPITGSQQVMELVSPAINEDHHFVAYVRSDGASRMSDRAIFEPHCVNYNGMFISNSPNGIGTFGSRTVNYCGTGYDGNGAYTSTTLGPQSSGSFTVIKYTTLTEVQYPTQTGITTIGFGAPNNNAGYGCHQEDTGLIVKLDSPQVKTDLDQLTIQFRIRWNRILEEV